MLEKTGYAEPQVRKIKQNPNKNGLIAFGIRIPPELHQRIWRIKRLTGRDLQNLIETWVTDGMECFEEVEEKERIRQEKYEI